MKEGKKIKYRLFTIIITWYYYTIRKTELLLIIQLLIPPGSKSVYSLILIQHRVYIVVYIKKHSYQLVYDIIDTAKQSKVK